MRRTLLLAALPALAGLAGCAHSARECAPIMHYGSAPPAALECAAESGDKRAQLELGIRYEEGAGVPRDLRRAERLYARAARTERRRRYVYSPPVGSERYGRVMPLSSAPGVPGLPEAEERLRRLRQARPSR